MKFGNFVAGVLFTALVASAALYACDSKRSADTLQSNSSASISGKPSDLPNPKPANQSELEGGRSQISPQQTAIDQLLETGACPGCDLKQANLEGLNLEGVNLEGANLEEANLAFARLENASLKKANLKRANLEGAALGCDLRLNLPPTQGRRGFSLYTHSNANDSGNSNVDMNVNLSRKGTGLDLYAEGNTKACVILHGADLKEAKLPDGSIYPY